MQPNLSDDLFNTDHLDPDLKKEQCEFTVTEEKKANVVKRHQDEFNGFDHKKNQN